MKNSLKKAMALFISVLMLFTTLPAGLADNGEGGFSDPVFPGIEDGGALLSGLETENITITFVVDNPVYTNDPGSGETHLTSNAPISGGELTYTSWAGIYKVTGTGTICSFTIPSGTSLSENGYDVPALSVTNITNTNTYEYMSPRSYLTSQGRVCGKNTIFTEDTTLHISLYQASETCGVDFICCDEHCVSFNFFCNIGSPTLRLGESLSQDNIISYENIMEDIGDQNGGYLPYSDNKHNLTHFAGWRVKNTATGQYEDFYAGKPITADYKQPALYNDSIKIYALWQVPPTPVTATFINGTTTVEERPLIAGNALGELPDLTNLAQEGYILVGWQYNDGNGLVYANEATIIEQDTTYNAVFVEETYYDITFHDILPNGQECDMFLTQSMLAGIAIGDADDIDALEWADGKKLSDCVWYTYIDGVKTPVDLSTAIVSGDLDLYTYSYDFTLVYDPNGGIMTLSLVNVEPGENGTMTITITAREGEQLKLADFVINGVDYSLYEWIDQATNTAIDLQSLITNGLTDTIVATSTGGVFSSDIISTQTQNVNFYIFIDDQRYLLHQADLTTYKIADTASYGGKRYYLPASTMESVYGDFGFRAEDMVAGTHYFPNASRNNTEIWADAAIKEVEGRFFTGLGVNLANADVYYLPKQSLTAASDQMSNYQQSDSFYSVTVQDNQGLVYAAADLPQPTYTLRGNTCTVYVDNAEDVQWTCIGTNGNVIGGTVENGMTTFVINGITQPYVISAVSTEEELPPATANITYNINRPNDCTPIDMEYGCPKIEGEDIYSLVLEEGTTQYQVLAPSMMNYFYLVYDKDNKIAKYIGEAEFLGWALNDDTDNLIQPGTVIDLASYNGSLNFAAQWHAEHADRDHKVGPMVNFYVSLAAHPVDNANWQGNIDQAFFTDSVYTDSCGVPGILTMTNPDWLVDRYTGGTEIEDTGNVDQYFVIGGTTGTNVNNNHDEIVSRLTEGFTYVGVNGNSYHFQTSFPTDEQVLQRVRQLMNLGGDRSHIFINGIEIPVEEMTTDNYSIRWYVFKYDKSDGWHIDGVLVSKTGTMVVTKTFAGDEDAIAAVKENYSINVEIAPNQTGMYYTGANLMLSEPEHEAIVGDGAEAPACGTYGPSRMIGTNTYVWEIPVDRHYRYNVTENNYIYTGEDGDLTTSTAQYNVQNSLTAGENTTGWQQYTTSVQVTGQSNKEGFDNKLTVNLLNTYMKSGTIVLQKVDDVTGNGMGGLTFDVKDEHGNPVYLQSTGGSQYTEIPSNDLDAQSTTEIVTDNSGHAYLTLMQGTYKLTENVPNGYEDPGVITVTLENINGVTVITGASAQNNPNAVQFTENTLELKLRNHAQTTNLIVEKVWNSANGETKPVTIQLYRNGAVLGSPITFDGVVDSVETTPWKHTFNDMPLYVDGQRAIYTIREESIGNFSYSSDYPDGYRYYTVEYSTLVYKDGQGQVTTAENAVTAELKVTNSRNTGALTFKKVNEYGAPLAGAVFALYNADGTDVYTPSVISPNNLVKTVTSSANGDVSFGTVNEGQYYYLVETVVPTGYEQSENVYRLWTQNGVIAMERWNGEAWEDIDELKVINTRIKADITVKKLVTGSLGDRNKQFSFALTSTEPMGTGSGYILSQDGKTATFTLRHNQTVVIKNVPVGAQLNISELDPPADYQVSVKIDSPDNPQVNVQGNSLSNLVSADGMMITFTNHKDVAPDAGVLLDSLPYALILAVVVVAGVVTFLLKRRNKDDD